MRLYKKSVFFCLTVTLLISGTSFANETREKALDDFRRIMKPYTVLHPQYVDEIRTTLNKSDKTNAEIISFAELLKNNNTQLFKNRRAYSIKEIILGFLNTQKTNAEIQAIANYNQTLDYLMSKLLDARHYYAKVFVAMIDAQMTADEMALFFFHVTKKEHKNKMKKMNGFERANYIISEINNYT